MNNLLVLSRESETGASLVWNDGKIIETLLKIIDENSANEAIVVAAARVLDELAKNSDRVFFSTRSLFFRNFKFTHFANFSIRKYF